ncbi:MAG: hypothetical protein AMXMBFR33_02030 [Candidatus Xenobia bacterium]
MAGCAPTTVWGLADLAGLPAPPDRPGHERHQRTEPEATYVYRDAAGEPYHRVTRRPGKQFFQARWAGLEWEHRAPATTLPYRLPELLAADPTAPIVWCEGEKDADRAARLGLVATTSPGGSGTAGKLGQDALELLRGRQVVIIPDHDDPGRKYASTIATRLRQAGATVRLLDLAEHWPPGSSPGKGADLSDWLDAGGQRERLLALAAGAPEPELAAIEPEPEAARAPWSPMPDVLGELAERYRQGRQREGYVSTGLRRVDALTQGLGPGQLVLLGGRPGEGKSAFGLQVAANVSRAHGPVLLITLEMSALEVAGRLVQQHLQIGHDEVTADRIERVRGEYPRLYLCDTGAALEEVQGLADTFRRQHPDAALVVLDYLGLVRPRGSISSSYERVSLVARELKILAQRLELPLLALVQLKRPARPDDPPGLTDLRDSGELEQAANKVVLLHRRPGTVTEGEAPRTVVITLAKNREGATGSIELHWQPATLSLHTIEPREPEPRRYEELLP